MEDVIQIERIGARLLKMKIVIGRKVLNIFSAYSPKLGRSEENRDIF